MSIKKRITFLLLLTALTFGVYACTGHNQDSDQTMKDIRVGIIKGPTGMGAAYLMNQDENKQSENDYTFYLTAAPSDMVGQITSENVDIAAIPTNLAANLYNKTNGQIKIIALNTKGVLHILENGSSVNTISDLKGKTIYAVGQAANPEYILNYLLKENGLDVGKDVQLEYRDGDEVAAQMAAGTIDLCMLPVPYATSVLLKNAEVRQAIDLSKCWKDTRNDESELIMGCVVVRSQFLLDHKEEVQAFLKEYAQSIDYAVNHADEAADMMVKYEIIANAEIAKQAIPQSNLVCITGSDIKTAITPYFQVLLEAEPASVGGKMPADDFYYED